ncbi:hypothetical protein D3C72_835640 [compost metagenome]
MGRAQADPRGQTVFLVGWGGRGHRLDHGPQGLPVRQNQLPLDQPGRLGRREAPQQPPGLTPVQGVRRLGLPGGERVGQLALPAPGRERHRRQQGVGAAIQRLAKRAAPFGRRGQGLEHGREPHHDRPLNALKRAQEPPLEPEVDRPVHLPVRLGGANLGDVRIGVVHPGDDEVPLLLRLQRKLTRRAAAVEVHLGLALQHHARRLADEQQPVAVHLRLGRRHAVGTRGEAQPEAHLTGVALDDPNQAGLVHAGLKPLGRHLGAQGQQVQHAGLAAVRRRDEGLQDGRVAHELPLDGVGADDLEGEVARAAIGRQAVEEGRRVGVGQGQPGDRAVGVFPGDGLRVAEQGVAGGEVRGHGRLPKRRGADDHCSLVPCPVP